MVLKECYKQKREITDGFLADVEFIPEFQWQLGLSWMQAQELKAVSELPAALDRRHLHCESESLWSAWLESESIKWLIAGWVLDSVPWKDWLRKDDRPSPQQTTFWLWAFTPCCLRVHLLCWCSSFHHSPTSDTDFWASIKHGQKSSDPLTTSWLPCQTGTSKTSSQVDWVLLDSHTPLMDCLASILNSVT